MSDPKSTPIPSDPDVARGRAKLARYLAAAFASADATTLDLLADPAVEAELREAAVALGIAGPRIDALSAALQDRAAGEDAFARLLGHTVRSECPPYELEYRTAEIFQQSQTLADIAGFYNAFGFARTGWLSEREDHAAAEWEFLAILSMLESLARTDEERARSVEAQRAFLYDHAALWMPAFFERLQKADAPAHLAPTAALADTVLRSWCAARDVPVGSKWLDLRPVSEEDSTITCGAPGAVELGPTLAAAMEERP